MNIDWVALTQTVPYGAIAVIFGLFVLKLLERLDAATVKRQEMMDTKEATRDKAFIAAQDRWNNEWRSFLQAERERRAANAERIAEELKGVAQAVGNVQALVSQHDIWERTFAEHMALTRGKDKETTDGKPDT